MHLPHARPANATHIIQLPDTPRTQLFPPPRQQSPLIPILDGSALENEALHGTCLAQRALADTLQCKHIATATADVLQYQTNQLEQIHANVTTVHHTLDVAEATIEELKHSKVRRALFRPVKYIKESIDGKEREQRRIQPKRETDTKRETGMHGGKAEHDEYAEYDNEKVREQLRMQDRYLEQTGVQLEELKELAVGIQQEVEYEAQVVDAIDANAVTARIRRSNRTILGIVHA